MAMSAKDNYATKQLYPVPFKSDKYAIASNGSVFGNSLVGLKSDGTVESATGATSYTSIMFQQDRVEVGELSHPDSNIVVLLPINGVAPTSTDIGSNVYVLFDNEVTRTVGTNALVGKVVAIEDAKVYVFIKGNLV